MHVARARAHTLCTHGHAVDGQLRLHRWPSPAPRQDVQQAALSCTAVRMPLGTESCAGADKRANGSQAMLHLLQVPYTNLCAVRSPWIQRLHLVEASGRASKISQAWC